MNKRIIALMLIVCILTGVFTGCGKKKTENETAVEQTTDTEETTQASETTEESELETEPSDTSSNVSVTPASSDADYSDDFDALEDTGRAQYRVNLSINRPDFYGDEATVEGTAHITFENYSEDTWNDLCIRDYNPSNLWEADYDYISEKPKGDYHTAITSVTRNGTPLNFSEQDDPSIVMVDLDEPLAPGEATSVDIAFTLSVPLGYTRQSYIASDHLTTDQPTGESIIMALGPFVPNIAAYDTDHWAADPYFEEGECFFTRCSDYKVHLEVPDGFNAVSTGDEINNADGSFDMSADNVRDFALFAGDDLTYIEGEYNGIPVRVWFAESQEGMRDIAEESLDTAIKALEVFSDYFGEYAYDSYDVIYSGLAFGGMEYPSIVWISDVILQPVILTNDPSYRDQIMTYVDEVIVHETAHEWFYSCVGNDEFNEPWLDEGFATFCELIYLEETGHADDSSANVSIWRRSQSDCSNPPIDLACDECVTTFEFEYGEPLYSDTIYSCGALFLYELRDAMGKEAFESFIHDWYCNNMNTEVSTELFLNTLFAADDSEAVRDVVEEYFRDENIPD